MPLQYVFGPLTGAPTSDLDANFQTVGLLGVLPCSVTGTNALTLALLNSTNAPTVSAYANYLAFSFVAGNTNTGAVTATVGTVGALNVYKNTVSGPAALVAGDIVIHNTYTLVYDSALNSGSGGFHIYGAPYLTSGQVPGTTTNDDASAGNIGEYQTVSVASGSAVTLTSGTAATLAATTLTAGDWDVWLQPVFSGGTTTSLNYLECSLATNGTISTIAGAFSTFVGAGAATFNFGVKPTLTCGPVRFSLASSTPIYGLAAAAYTTSSVTVYGLLRARRVR